jgi:LCP family protein required for cell wall assembly
MKPAQKAILATLAAAACLLLTITAALGVQSYQFWALQPMGPRLNSPTASGPLSLPATWTPAPLLVPTSQKPIATPIPGLTAIPLESADPALAGSSGSQPYTPLCGGPPVMQLLAVGSDARSDRYMYGLGDVIRLVRIDFRIPRVTVLEYPRDLWVQIPDIADNLKGQDHERLNQAYLYGNKGFGYTNDPAEGPGLLARTLNLNFGTQSDHYVAVNMRTFVNVVNAVDGIDVYLPAGMDGRTKSDRSARLVFPAGNLHLNGDQALTLARIRNHGVFSRADNQDLVLCALRKKLVSPDVVIRIPQLITSFRDNIQTDLSPQQISQLACLGPKIRAENIVFASFPKEHFKTSRIFDPVFKSEVFIWDVDFSILRDYTARFQAGTWPAPGLAPTTAEGEEPVIVCQ